MPQPMVDRMNALLRAEIAAVGAYRQAIAELHDDDLKAALEGCVRSHETRVSRLRDHVEQLGGVPVTDAGPWDPRAKLVPRPPPAGNDDVLAALEATEELGLADYERDAQQLDGDSRRLVLEELLPEQQRTCGQLSRLAHGGD